MPVIGAVADAVRVIADLVDQTRTILEALDDGRAYLRAHHPDAAPDLAELLRQMRATVAGLERVAAIVTQFDFVVDGSDRDRQPARFNDLLLRFGGERADLANDLAALRGSCHQVLQVSNALQQRAGDRPWWALFGDRAGQRAAELGATMMQLYGYDNDMAYRAQLVLDATEAALDAVRDALRGDVAAAAISTANVDAAAVVLHEQAGALRPELRRLRSLRDDLDASITALD